MLVKYGHMEKGQSFICQKLFKDFKYGVGEGRLEAPILDETQILRGKTWPGEAGSDHSWGQVL